MSIQDAIAALVNDRRDLSEDEAADALGDVFRGAPTPAPLSASLAALRLTREPRDDIVATGRTLPERPPRVAPLCMAPSSVSGI